LGFDRALRTMTKEMFERTELGLYRERERKGKRDLLSMA